MVDNDAKNGVCKLIVNQKERIERKMNESNQKPVCQERKRRKNCPSTFPSEDAEKLEQLIRELHVAQMIRDELTAQGRTVVWLAKKLGVGRTSLYYLFSNDSISVELLLRISFYLEHNFMQDVVDVYMKYGL